MQVERISFILTESQARLEVLDGRGRYGSREVLHCKMETFPGGDPHSRVYTPKRADNFLNVNVHPQLRPNLDPPLNQSNHR